MGAAPRTACARALRLEPPELPQVLARRIPLLDPGASTSEGLDGKCDSTGAEDDDVMPMGGSCTGDCDTSAFGEADLMGDVGVGNITICVAYFASREPPAVFRCLLPELLFRLRVFSISFENPGAVNPGAHRPSGVGPQEDVYRSGCWRPVFGRA